MKRKHVSKKRKKKLEDIVMDVICYSFLIIFAFACIYPIWYVVVASFTSSEELLLNPGFLLWPEKPITSAYREVFKNHLLMNSYKNTLKILFTAIPLNIMITVTCGYFMACEGLFFKKYIMAMIMFTMFFSGGTIPSLINIRELGLYNTHWALILPGVLGIHNAIITRASIQAIPDSLIDAAYMDGAHDFQVVFKVILPLIKPTLAVLVLYYGVAHWNSWFEASVYLNETDKMPLQNILRTILGSASVVGGTDGMQEYSQAIKYAAVVISTVPILCVYPFLQKYFAKGALIGAVKG